MLHIRQIRVEDNPTIEKIIKDALVEFKANKPGTVYFDPQTAFLYQYYKTISRSKYYIALYNNEIVGGAGYGPTDSLNTNTCELQKLYVNNTARGKKIGRALIEHCIIESKIEGYDKMYLETMAELTSGLKLYEKLGFKHIEYSIGATGHDACEIKMLKLY